MSTGWYRVLALPAVFPPPWEPRYGESSARLTDSQLCALPPVQFSRKDAARTDATDDRPPESPPCHDEAASPILSPMDRGRLGFSTSPRPVGAVRGPSPPPGSAGSDLTRRVSGLRASGTSSRLPTRRDSSTQIFFGRLPDQRSLIRTSPSKTMRKTTLALGPHLHYKPTYLAF